MKFPSFLLLLCASVLGAVVLMPAQQQPKTAPSNSAVLAARESNADVSHNIQARLDIDSGLTSTVIRVEVTDDAVWVRGYVNSIHEKDRAVSIAQSYAGSRTVVDAIQMGYTFGDDESRCDTMYNRW